MKILNLEQGTPEWHKARKGKMTGSKADTIATNGKGLDTYVMEICAGTFSSGEDATYSNADMERGKSLEASARSTYELRHYAAVQTVGFVEMDEFVGVSPDGLVGEDGMVEFKCPKDRVYFELLLNGKDGVDSGYVWQMQMQMLVCGRAWCDFVSYNPNFEQDLIVHRFERDLKKHEALTRGINSGKLKIQAIMKKFEELNNK